MTNYLSVTKMEFLDNMAYKFEFFTNYISILINIFVFFFLWSAIYAWNNATVIGGLSLSQMVTYSIISVLIGWCVEGWTEWIIEDDVRRGNLSMLLVKPINYQLYTLALSFGDFLANTFVKALPAFLVATLLLNLLIPDLLTFLLFLISIVFSFLIHFAIAFIVGLLAFWTTGSIWGFIRFKRVLFTLFAGSFVPLYFFPDWFQSIAAFLPFQGAYHTPLSIYIGKLTGTEVVFAIGVQLFWVVILFGAGYLVMRSALSKFTSQGG